MPLSYNPNVPAFLGGLIGVHLSSPKNKELVVEAVIPQFESQFSGNEFQPEDEIVAIDGVLVDKDTFWSEYLHKGAGDAYTITVKRGEVEVILSRNYLVREENMFSLV